MAQGQTLGIIGGTGSGKSSVLHLISRFYDAQEGSVRVMGQDVREYRFSALRRAISLVPQKAVLYGGTILENMRRIRADATEDEVISALQTAQAWEFVSKLPEGIHTQLSQGGMNLSGGQRQRLGIARALLGHPPVVVLDDSMSALDYATDLALRRALSTDLAGTTVILVSQRVSSILHADHILVLEDGEQVGFGTHDTLRQTCPVYEEICRAQMQKEA